MEYIDWCDRVARAFIEIWAELPTSPHSVVRASDIATHLALSHESTVFECIEDAMRDLERFGLVDTSRSAMGADGRRWRATQWGESLRNASLRTSWRQAFDAISLLDHQREYLATVVSLSEDRLEDMARVREVCASEVAAAEGREWGGDALLEGYELTRQLEDLGLLWSSHTAGDFQIYPTYLGIVLATQQVQNEDRRLVDELRAERETTNADLKRELDLSRDAAKAEFTRDVLGLANAQLRGSRYLVIGIDDDGNEYADAPPDLTRERIEQIVQAWAPPAPPLSLTRVRLERVEVALIEVGREPAHLPYVASKEAAKLKKGVVYSRHGTHTQPATPEEEQSIREEGDRARAAMP